MQNYQQKQLSLDTVLFEVEELEERLENSWGKPCYQEVIQGEGTEHEVHQWIEVSCRTGEPLE